MKFQLILYICLAMTAACGWLRKDEGGNGGRSASDLDALRFTGGINYFSSCGEIQGKVRSILENKKSNDRAEIHHFRNKRSKFDYDRNVPTQEDSFSDAAQGSSAGQPFAPGAANAGNSEEGGAKSDSDNGSDIQTNLQEQGVDEADFVKANEHHIYSYDDGEIQVADRETLEYIGQLSTGDLENITLFTDEDRLIVIGSEEKSRTVCAKSEDNERRCRSIDDAETEVRVYTSRAGKLPKKSYEFDVLGTYQDARMVDGELYLVSQDGIQVNYGKAGDDPLDPIKPIEQDDDDIDPVSFTKFGTGNSVTRSTDDEETIDNGGLPNDDPRIWTTNRTPNIPNLATHKIADEPVGLDEGDKSLWGVPCDEIIKPPVDDIDFNLMKVTRLNTRKKGAKAIATGSLGTGDIVYATERSIYTTKQGVNWMPWTPSEDATTGKELDDLDLKRQEIEDQLAVFKITLELEDKVRFTGSAVLEGRLKDRWALKEYNKGDNLAVATTTGLLNGEGDLEARNHLFALQHQGPNLEVASAIRDFGENEDIRAIRYIGDIAYIVTFRQTDPLFAFDLSDPTDVRLLSELKIPGFSTYLHPISDERMVGVGFDAIENDDNDTALYQGIQVSLFDIEDPEDLERLDNKTHGERGSHSEVTANSRAFYFDSKTDIFAIPLVEVSATRGGLPVQVEDDSGVVENPRSGAVFYKVRDDELDRLGWASHAEMIPSGCRHLLSSSSGWQVENRSVDVNRIFKLDGRVLSISRWGLKAHKVNGDGVTVDTATTFDEKTTSAICQQIREPVRPFD